MAERKLADVKWDIERCTCHVPDACSDCSHKVERVDFPVCMENLMLEAYELLKEQEVVEPKKTAYQRVDHTIAYRYRCGTCDMSIFPSYKYCPFCGQAVKWE